MHRKYHGFWIRNTQQNRRKVDTFPERILPRIHNQRIVNLERLCDISDAMDEFNKTDIGTAARVACLRKVLRLVVVAYENISNKRWLGFLRTLYHKLLEFCQNGISEAYLTFSLFFPEMCTREIQPVFNFKTIYYSDGHLDDLSDDPVFGPLAKKVRYMSGYNKLWRQCKVRDAMPDGDWELDHACP